MTMHFDDDIYPVSRITAGSVGESGRRVFLIQAMVGGEQMSWVIEKEHAMALSRTIPRLIEEVHAEFPELAEPIIAARPNLELSDPITPEFRVGAIGLGYDRIHDLVILTLAEATRGLSELSDDEEDADSPTEIEVFTTRGQALLLGQQAQNVVAAGRPLCPSCGEPIDDFGHFCLPRSMRGRSLGELVQ